MSSLFFVYYLCEKHWKSITVQYHTADRVSWVPKLSLFDLWTHSQKQTCSYVGNLLDLISFSHELHGHSQNTEQGTEMQNCAQLIWLVIDHIRVQSQVSVLPCSFYHTTVWHSLNSSPSQWTVHLHSPTMEPMRLQSDWLVPAPLSQELYSLKLSPCAIQVYWF